MLRRYWAFKRECLNAALLAMIMTSVRRATECGRPIHVNPEPKSLEDALANLEAFSAECCGEDGGSSHRPGWKPVDIKPLVNNCFGWTEISRDDTYKALRRASRERCQWEISRPYADMDNNESRFAIVYSFVPKDELDPGIVQEQLDFFHLVGFCLVPFNEGNWRGKGTLVDFCDLVAPHSKGWWWVIMYRRMIVRSYFAEKKKRYVEKPKISIL